jgi:hypothetical protein
MSYRDRATGPNSILDIGTDMLRRAAKTGVKARLAVETQPLVDCAHCTFAEEGAAALAAEAGRVDGEAARYPSYAGLAVHHFDAWQKLRS